MADGAWGSDPIIVIMVLACTLAGVISIPRFQRMIPYVAGSMLRWKATMWIDESVPLSRDRNLLFVGCVLPICLIGSKYYLYSPEFLQGLEPWQYTAALTLGLLGILLYKALFTRILHNRMGDDAWIVFFNDFNRFIIVAVTLVFLGGLLPLAKVPVPTIRTILFTVYALTFAAFFYKNWQILSWKGLRFTAFLYLCGLELGPLVLLVASALIF